MRASILTIGDELLIGQVIDTNSAWLADSLTELGFEVTKILSISDSSQAIAEAVNELMGQSDLVISTGGLGPTSDDRTKPTLCELFGGQLMLHAPSLSLIEQIFHKRGLPLTETNKNQALIPSSCTPILNYHGTAPGMIFRKGNCLLISLPGVPFEMKNMFTEGVRPFIEQNFTLPAIVRVTVNTFGIPESFLSDKLKDFEIYLADRSIALAYLPSPSGIRLRLTATGENKGRLSNLLDMAVNELKSLIGENIFGFNDETLPSVVSKRLREKNATLAVAESCTGGYISHLITQLPGSSDIYKGGIVAYSNEIKQNVLGVSHDLLISHGAVSQPVVEAMLDGTLRVFQSEYAIAVSGIAGPTGATAGKPVGTTWIGVASRETRLVELYTFGNLREVNIQRAAYTALHQLLKLMDKD
ncbi:MAG: CinA family nicotinamide mononucleotide deamidase-related protein [Tenuifilum sp.]|uniref:CinA family nicotinamide mononucleotide deamidase-related protein n=1 Tax=Tenuifilum sp. TaxID=2760880 RepID=UPI001B4AF9F2|nr:CinA family nicotinamide mononucleotide deamidase-related protein [Bacteroidales bacterium]HOK60355.1 CinA family nicotinamide mononucleotide deamidase-related protein [Tenuifilum sp.]MBP9029237.1 CinA family nicotinamide mononucleotide deamidase-related protein [Bacteroidales bacterium]HOK85203.1 CinA family nicotinamide mononucleotide deamidase-related protein [Tenuifilum sp.]HON69579.1 CinA family nicotinamide mononucleotide deamidase-related protein [Tenuifilum sp.]